MTTFALLSEYPSLSPLQKEQVDHIIADDGTWTPAEILAYTQTIFAEDIETERREGYAYDNIV